MRIKQKHKNICITQNKSLPSQQICSKIHHTLDNIKITTILTTFPLGNNTPQRREEDSNKVRSEHNERLQFRVYTTH